MNEEFEPIYCEIDEINISQIIFEKSAESKDVTIFGYFLSENTQKMEKVSYWCDFSTLTELLNIAKEETIIDLISEKLSNFEIERPIVIDIENLYGSYVKIENICLTIYKPSQNIENKEKAFEDDEEFYIIDSIFNPSKTKLKENMSNKISVKFDYSSLRNTQYVGEFGEQLIRLNFTINNIDTFVPLIDDKGIDFIARTETAKYFDIQVKTIRLTKERYFYESKEKWGENIRPNLLIAFVILITEKEPILLLIPGKNWEVESLNNKIFSNRDYEGLKSKAEWGLTLNEKNIDYLIEKYEINKTLETL